MKIRSFASLLTLSIFLSIGLLYTAPSAVAQSDNPAREACHHIFQAKGITPNADTLYYFRNDDGTVMTCFLNQYGGIEGVRLTNTVFETLRRSDRLPKKYIEEIVLPRANSTFNLGALISILDAVRQFSGSVLEYFQLMNR